MAATWGSFPRGLRPQGHLPAWPRSFRPRLGDWRAPRLLNDYTNRIRPVDVGFSDSQLELRAAVRDVLAKECPPALVRSCLDDPDAWRPLWRTFVELGWTSLALFDEGSELEDGGLGVIELVAVLEEL